MTRLVSLMGNTPLVRLRKVTAGLQGQVIAKVEYFNPGGSVKDRIAVRMIDAAEASGALKPAARSSTDLRQHWRGLAIVAQERGYKCVFVVPDKVAADKVNVMRATGPRSWSVPRPSRPSTRSRTTRSPTGSPATCRWPGSPTSTPTPRTRARNYESTGPELWAQTDGRITHFVRASVRGARSPGPASTSRRSPAGKVKIIGADPEGSVYSGGSGRPYLVEGVGEDIWPET